jgi:p-hydroxybenzoate 3-monooxygenase
VRAGLLEQGTVEIVRRAGVAARLDRDGLVHHGVGLAFGERTLRIDFAEHGAAVTVYGQTELTRDLVDARDALGERPRYESEVVALDGVAGDAPAVRYRRDGIERLVRCDFVAGCDGFRGVSRAAIPASLLRTHERVYPFAWLGVLATAKPVSSELLYASHERGFALCSMRSETLTRCYVQCDAGDDPAAWSDERFWNELRARLPSDAAASVEEAPTIEKSVAALRSFVAEPLQHGRLFLAGDAAHIVPPTGAKGLNLAARDVYELAQALSVYYSQGRDDLLRGYSAAALARIWRAERFSAWMTSLLHRFPSRSSFDRGLQLAELEHLAGSAHARAAFVEGYAGTPLGRDFARSGAN